MPVIQNILRFLDTQAAAPRYFGILHIVFILLTVAAAITLCILWKKEKIRDINKVILVVSAVLLVLGLYKQIVVSFEYDPALKFNYDWDHFPWNFSSIPLLVGLLIGFTSQRVSKHFVSYYATFGLLAGLWGMLNPDTFVSTIGLNVYHMLCYGAFISLAILVFYSQSVRIEIKTFLKALPVFVLMVGVAISFNEVAHLIVPGHKISLFEISRHDTSTTAVYSMLHNLFYASGGGMSLFEYVICVLFYIVLVCAFAALPLLVMMLVKKLLSSDFEAEFGKQDALATGLRKSEGLDGDDQEIFKFGGKVNSRKNTYMKTYFQNLNTNLGNNYKGSCGYVAAAMLLSYYDTILSDKIVPREFEKTSTSHDNPDFSESPGTKFYQFEYNPDEINYKDYVKVINKAKNTYLHERLLSIAVNKQLTDASDDKGPFVSTVNYVEKVMNHYLKNVAAVKKCEYDIRVKDNSNEIGNAKSDLKKLEYSNQIRKYAISKVKKGYPVWLGVHNAKGEGHAVIAYEYDKKTDKLYCHLGYRDEVASGAATQSFTHLTPEEKGYTIYSSALVLEFDEDKISHTHTNNYEVVIGGSLFYYCVDGRYTTCDDLLVEFGKGKTELSVTGVYGKYPKDQLTIPEYYGDVRVANIAPHSFENQEHITRAVISANIPAIPKKAFEDCESLTTVIIPESVRKLGSEAFGECPKLTNIIYLGTKEQWHSIKKSSSWDRKTGNYRVHCADGVLIKLHAEGRGDLLENTRIDEKYFEYQNVKPRRFEAARASAVGKCNFDKEGNLTRVVIADKTPEISKKTFENCDELTTVIMPKSVKKIDSEAFAYCRKLSSISFQGTTKEWFDIDKKNSWDKKTGKYRVICLDGALTKSQANGEDDFLIAPSTLSRVDNNEAKERDSKRSSNRNVKYPNLGTYAYDKNGNVTHVIVSANTTKIPKDAFDDCKLLSTIVVPSTVKIISKDAFEDCSKLENIIYLGTQAQWCEIDKKDDWDEDTSDYTIVCLDGVIYKRQYESGSDDVEKPLLPKDAIQNGRLIYEENITKKYDVAHSKDSITEVIISNKISKISKKEFKDWSSLEIIALHKGIEKIGEGAFENCTKLKTILYSDTKEQWYKIKKGESWNKNSGLYTVNCSDGRLTKTQSDYTTV